MQCVRVMKYLCLDVDIPIWHNSLKRNIHRQRVSPCTESIICSSDCQFVCFKQQNDFFEGFFSPYHTRNGALFFLIYSRHSSRIMWRVRFEWIRKFSSNAIDVGYLTYLFIFHSLFPVFCWMKCPKISVRVQVVR